MSTATLDHPPVTDAEVERFNRDGYFVVRGALPPERVAHLLAVIERLDEELKDSPERKDVEFRPTKIVPATEKESLRSARDRLELDVLALIGWQNETHLSAAIPIRQNERTVAALALSGRLDDINIDRVRSLLHQGAREIESALRDEKARVA